MEYNKENLFISGYNDELVNIGDWGIFGEKVDCIKSILKDRQIFMCSVFGKKDDGTFTSKHGIEHQMFYRLEKAPKKKLIPWTKETFPLSFMSSIKTKESDHITCIMRVNESTEHVWLYGDPCARSFKDLFDFWELPDGSPCGTEVTE